MSGMRTYVATLRLKKEFKVKVTPNASSTEIREYDGEVLHIRLKSIPDKGKANKELIKYLKKESRINVKIIKGKKVREKNN
jgi:uncharacterized protein